MTKYKNIQAPMSINQLGDKVYFQPKTKAPQTFDASRIIQQSANIFKYYLKKTCININYCQPVIKSANIVIKCSHHLFAASNKKQKCLGFIK